MTFAEKKLFGIRFMSRIVYNPVDDTDSLVTWWEIGKMRFFERVRRL